MFEKYKRKNYGPGRSKERQAMRRGAEFQKRQSHEQQNDANGQVDVIKFKSYNRREIAGG